MSGSTRQFVLSSAMATFLSACADDWKPAFDEALPRDQVGRVAIADIDQALTFARVGAKGGRRVLAVTSYQPSGVEGVDLSARFGASDADPIQLYLEHGYDALRDVVRDTAAAARVRVALAELVMPVDLLDRHVAVGTNYAEHAGDAGTERPFLFPKWVTPTRADAPVSAGAGLLDYEVELAFVPLEPLRQGSVPSTLGLMLCNDYTDRETLMHAIDARDIESGKGFTTGKSFPGYLPVGNLFVIPRDFRSFAKHVRLQLFVNDRLRQRAVGSEMIWDIDEILAQTWKRRDVEWDHRGQPVSLFGKSDTLPARTLIMSGTPHGTVFNGLPKRHMVAGLLSWLFGGWSRSIPEHVVDKYVAAAHAAGAYLQPGDRVLIQVDGLGAIENEITR